MQDNRQCILPSEADQLHLAIAVYTLTPPSYFVTRALEDQYSILMYMIDLILPDPFCFQKWYFGHKH